MPQSSRRRRQSRRSNPADRPSPSLSSPDRQTPNRQTSSRPPRLPNRRRFPWWILLLPGLIWVGYRQLASHWSKPQAILVLGGSPDRERFAAGLAKDYPELPIWVSSGSNKEYSEWVFEQAGIDPSRIHLDYRAVDTLTNFTTLMDDLHAQGITSLYLVTSDYHMRRAQWIAEVVGGRRGMVFKSVPIPTDMPEEPIAKSFRDSARAVVWTLTGYTGTKEKTKSEE
jgi:uncharacterized SAM-binding protein YcdF (DUF218 family)